MMRVFLVMHSDLCVEDVLPATTCYIHLLILFMTAASLYSSAPKHASHICGPSRVCPSRKFINTLPLIGAKLKH